MPAGTLVQKTPVQLSFQFEELENLIACVGSEDLSGRLLSSLLETLRPSYFFDLRSCPRFDLSDGYSRKRVFADLERCGARYLYLSSSETNGAAANRVSALISKLGRDADHLKGPLVVVVESAAEAELISRAMPKPTTPSGQWLVSTEGTLRNETSDSAKPLLRCVVN